MKVVLDTNVLFSALISPHGAPELIYRAWRSAKFELVTSLHQLDEIKKASKYPKFKSILQPARVGTMINNLQHTAILDRLKIEEDTNDPNDAFLISMAIAGKADYLVTGDRRSGLLQKKKIQKTRILTPSDFCSKVLHKY